MIRDFSLGNVVWDGVHKNFVVIDGVGGKFGSLRPYLQAYNRRSNKKRVEKFKRRLENALAEKAAVSHGTADRMPPA